MDRRRFLELATLSTSILAGCSETSESSPTASKDSPVETLSESSPTESDAESTPTETSTKEPDTEEPRISAAIASSLTERGLLELQFEGRDDGGIDTASASTPVERVTESYGGDETFTLESELQGTPGDITQVEFIASDLAGNEARASDETYVRRNTALEPARLELGATYRLHPEHDNVCPDVRPTIGEYSELNEEVVKRHVDELQGAGFSRILVRINDRHDLKTAKSYSKTKWGGKLPMEFRFGFLDWTLEDVPIKEQIRVLTEGIKDHPNYHNRADRPVVSLRQIHSINARQGRPKKVWDHILSEFNSPEKFVEYIRNELTLDGNSPYLIGETSVGRRELVRPRMQETGYPAKLLKQLDAIRNTFDPVFPDHGNALVRTLSELKWDIRDAHLFSNRENIEFEPLVVPGYLNSRTDCPSNQSIPRDPTRFEAFLAYAAYYSTSNRVVVDSFNDWMRGTQIEPGGMGNEDYAQSYIHSVRNVAGQNQFVTRSDRSVHHIKPDGSDSNPGSKSMPLASIQEGIMRAGPGDTVKVHPGQYSEKLRTVRDGKPNAPITITGSKDAVLRAPDGISVWIKNSHIRLRGLTVDGLLDPEKPDIRESYSRGVLINCRPPDDVDEYLTNLVVAPARIGNSDRALMVFNRTEGLEIGPSRVIGLAGAEYVIGDATSHVGEIVYIGTPPSQIDKEAYPWDEVDQINDVHIHHIDNSAGHPHSELVNTKAGSHDVLVEYCTSAGGSQNTEPWPAADVRFSGRDVDLRWCDLRDGQAIGVEVQHRRSWLRNRDDPAVNPEQNGAGHAIYGNLIKGYGQKAIEIDTTPEEQRLLCGNDITGSTDGSPEQGCPPETPSGDGVGHLGGDSPWA